MPRILHLTDLHLRVPADGRAPRRPGREASLSRAIDMARRIAPDMVVLAGDLTDAGDLDSYQRLAQMLAVLDVPVICALGNHDRRAGFRAVFAGHPGAADDPLDHDRLVAGVHVVVLDSSDPGQVGGALAPAQIDWLRSALGRHADLPRVVVCHHPPRMIRGGARGWTTLDPDSSDALADALHGQGVQAILSGHVHTNRVGLWHGIPVVTAIGHDSAVDLTAGPGLTLIDATACAICDLRPEGLQVAFAALDAMPVLREIPAHRLPGGR